MNQAKCKDCKSIQPLDMLVKSESSKAKYICKDCKADAMQIEYDPLMSGIENNFPIRSTRIKNLFRWCLG